MCKKNMSPAQAKAEQHKRYNEIAIAVARGLLGYQPAVRSKYSKPASLKFKHDVEFK